MVKDIFVAGLAAGALMCCHAAFRGLEGIKRRETLDLEDIEGKESVERPWRP
jgi:hypothetical protein